MATVDAVAGLEELKSQKTFLQKSAELLRKQPLGAIGLAVVIAMIFMAVFANYLTGYDPEENDFASMLIAPGWEFLLGTDQFGRDIMTRLIYGARTALFVGFVASFVGATIGLVLGVMSAYFGGTFDLIFQRIMDVFMAFPLIIMALAIVSIFGPSTENVIIAITIPFIPRCARVVRSNALAIREIPYVDAARALGFSHARIILRHMAPNVMAPFLIMLTAFCRSGDPARGVAFLSRSRRTGAERGMGADAPGRCGRVRRERALDRDLPGHRHFDGRVRVQPVRRLRARRLGSPLEDAIEKVPGLD